ncbi:MAG: hypothetical protein ABGY75_07025 [Gemmataceae bacterium]
MARKTARKRTTKPATSGVTTAAKTLAAIALTVGLVAGVRWVGSLAAVGVADRDRYAVRTAALRFDPPPHTDPREFLTQVLYLADLPVTVQSIDPKLPDQIAAAFRQHPWVEDVTGVTVLPDGGVHVGVRYRTPVLAIRWLGGNEAESRAVDAAGVLLPADAPTARLPILTNVRTCPQPPAGRVWPEADVVRAADLVRRHPATTVERTPGGWTLTEPDGKKFHIATP